MSSDLKNSLPDTKPHLLPEAEAEAERLRAALAERLAVIGIWLQELNDADLGAVGAAFRECFAALDCAEYVNPLVLMSDYDQRKAPYGPTYIPFNYTEGNRTGGTSFVNKISYDPHGSLERAFLAHVHEGMHALQWNAAPALHASPWNARTRIILCPRDFVLMTERTEQDAYAKQVWLAEIAARDHPRVSAFSDYDPVSVSLFHFMRQSYGLNGALASAALSAMTRTHHIDDNGAPVSFGDHYHAQALSNMGAAFDWHDKCHPEGETLIFVRLEPGDIQAIGRSFAPNIFGDDTPNPAFMQRPVLSEDNEAGVAALNKRLGIVDDSALPTLREALAAIGLTPEQFLEMSKNPPARPAMAAAAVFTAPSPL